MTDTEHNGSYERSDRITIFESLMPQKPTIVWLDIFRKKLRFPMSCGDGFR